MFKNPQVQDFIDDAQSRAKQAAQDVRGRAESFAQDIRGHLPAAEDFVGRVADNARRLMKEQPIACLAAVGCLGLLIGLSSRSRR